MRPLTSLLSPVAPVALAALTALGTLGPLGATGCVELASDADTDADQVASTEQAVIECDTWVCGSNSPIIDSYPFHELNARGLVNDQGFSVLSLWKANVNYQLYVEHGRIIGRLGLAQITGAGLVGSEIRLRRGIQTFAIRVTAVGQVQTFARLAGSPRMLETYQLDTAEIFAGSPPTGWHSLCSNKPSRENPDVLDMNPAHALVFEGERIDAASKTIAPVLDLNWFNIGCAGHALAKMAINAQTEAAAQTYGFSTTILDRQAFLKMLTADYCGTGRTFTISGQPLQWMDWRGYTQYVASPADLHLEARWTPNGAACINTPRVIAHPSAAAQQALGNTVAWDIIAECGYVPPACNGSVSDLDGKLLVSANPL
jgi:hypothetical protein